MLISNVDVIREKARWSGKIPLKIKIFMWCLRKEVVLTKDNLGRRNRHEDKRSVFCSCNEAIQHLFFDCHFVKFVWRAVHITFGVAALTSKNHMCGDWLHGLNSRAKSLNMVGVATLCWALCFSRNNIVFKNVRLKHICRCFTWGRTDAGYGHSCRGVTRTKKP